MTRLSRRTFLQGVGAVAASRVVLGSMLAPATAAEPAKPFTRPLPIPKTLRSSRITLVAREANVPLLPGRRTRMWTFNGTFPGPTIRRPSGKATRVTVHNDLPNRAGSLTIHHHGAHSASKHDGLPLPEVAIARGKARTYVYEHQEDGKPERAALQWYHDHSHGRSSLNSWMGLAGFFILDDDVEKKLQLPGGAYELPLFITDRRFTPDNQLDTELFEIPAATREVGGDTHLVNGALQPYIAVEPRRYRLRIHNGSGFLLYNLVLRARDDAVAMTQIGTESGLLPARVEREEILLGPAERADIVVDFARFAGRTLTLESTTRANALGSDPSPAAALMQIRVGRTTKGRDTSKVPTTLRPLPEWVPEASPAPDRVWVFGSAVDATTGKQAHTINGRAFDHNRIDARVELDSVESWLLANTTTRTHYIHIHDVDWVVLRRNGAPPPPYEAGLKETFRLDPGESIVVAAKFSDHLGRYMIHCHMLDHEDGGMMAAWEVVAPGSGTAATLAGAATETPFTCPLP